MKEGDAEKNWNCVQLKEDNQRLKTENDSLALRITELENLITMKNGKIFQLEKLVDCYSSELESIPNVSNVVKQLESTLQIWDELRVDNFQLKTKLADECKKFHDLKECFIELRNTTENMKKDIVDKEKLTLIEEKNSLECTLLSLSEEVEFLSQKNEEFLKHLQSKDFYEEYKASTEELAQLRKAHVSLIDLIEGKEINIDDSVHPMADGLLRKWKRENFLNASIGRVHSNSLGAINTSSNYLLPPSNSYRVNKTGGNIRKGSHQHRVGSDRILEDGEFQTNYVLKDNNHREYRGSAFSRIFNWGGFDNVENHYELSINQDN